MGPIGCPETSVRNSHYSLRNNPEEDGSQLLCGGSLKSRIPKTYQFCYYYSTKKSFSQNTTIYSIMYTLLHVSVTSNLHQADISVYGHDMFSATVWDPILFTFAV